MLAGTGPQKLAPPPLLRAQVGRRRCSWGQDGPCMRRRVTHKGADQINEDLTDDGSPMLPLLLGEQRNKQGKGKS